MSGRVAAATGDARGIDRAIVAEVGSRACFADVRLGEAEVAARVIGRLQVAAGVPGMGSKRKNSPARPHSLASEGAGDVVAHGCGIHGGVRMARPSTARLFEAAQKSP